MAARRANGRGVRVQTWPEEVGPEPGGIEGSRFMGGQAWQGGSRPKIGHRLRPTSESVLYTPTSTTKSRTGVCEALKHSARAPSPWPTPGPRRSTFSWLVHVRKRMNHVGFAARGSLST